jgi:hypothetical protein
MKRNVKDNSTIYVYNFIFPHGCKEITIHGYVFRRVAEYKERVQALQHLGSSYSEFDRPTNTGTHAITATVQCPKKERKPVLEWGDMDATALDDILLLLSVLTLRDVFAVFKPIEKGEAAITADSREYFFGMRTAIEYEGAKDKHGNRFDIGFQKGIDRLYRLMCTAKWQKEYGRGRFLLLFRSACKRQILETSFITCWTIWEILFTVHNQSWLSDDQIIKLPASEKISYILTRYRIKDSLDQTDRKGIKRFVKIRNTIVHAGRFVDDSALHDATLFIRVTAIIVAKILGLSPSDVLGSQAQLLARLAGQEVNPPWKD